MRGSRFTDEQIIGGAARGRRMSFNGYGESSEGRSSRLSDNSSAVWPGA